MKKNKNNKVGKLTVKDLKKVRGGASAELGSNESGGSELDRLGKQDAAKTEGRKSSST